ncbi:MAG: hypothetical protein V4510_06160 [bacterium]
MRASLAPAGGIHSQIHLEVLVVAVDVGAVEDLPSDVEKQVDAIPRNPKNPWNSKASHTWPLTPT